MDGGLSQKLLSFWRRTTMSLCNNNLRILLLRTSIDSRFWCFWCLIDKLSSSSSKSPTNKGRSGLAFHPQWYFVNYSYFLIFLRADNDKADPSQQVEEGETSQKQSISGRSKRDEECKTNWGNIQWEQEWSRQAVRGGMMLYQLMLYQLMLYFMLSVDVISSFLNQLMSQLMFIAVDVTVDVIPVDQLSNTMIVEWWYLTPRLYNDAQ